MPHQLTTARLSLRPFTEADEDHLVRLDADPRVTRYLNGGRPTPRETVRTRQLPRLLHRHPSTGTVGYLAAEDRRTGAFLGWFELRPVREDSPPVLELGYRLRPDAWGRGLATEGARALVDRGFADLGAGRVIANTMAVNTASRRVLEKAGLRYVRTWFGDWPEPVEGSEHGDVEYALDRAAWRRRPGPGGP
ncbi:GNAT family N-acetyltransferase [Streptomyces marincola]|uniref:GNAT family N-acetyltransferase n=1 Tax=Streptomyces marincola TaxID=2878388 RepID=A0A1W7CTA2_9ACTN|nr:GNAT family N-acetyltransferase [Streptomyces marincola]ARQ67946.1 GNAT family N-acetyltransferase [Streptomyces marincola]